MKILKKLRGNVLTYAILVILFVLMLSLDAANLLTNQISGLLVPICWYVVLAVSLNLTVGISGELSLGHAGFMCIGAYVGSIFSLLSASVITNDLLRFVLAIIAGGLAAAIFGILIGIPVLRLRGDYLAIVTLAFGEIIKNVVSNLLVATDKNGLHISIITEKVKSIDNMKLDPATKRVILDGPAGISGVPRDSNFVIGFILVIICVAVTLNIINSRTGRAIMAIRDNRIAAESIGLDVTKYKLIAFTVSAMFAGAAGVLYPHHYTVLNATTKNFGYDMSIMILVLVVLGGIGSIRGSVISAIILTLLPELLREFGNFRMLIYAVVLIVMMIANNNPTIAGYVARARGFITDKLGRLRPSAKKKKEA